MTDKQIFSQAHTIHKPDKSISMYVSCVSKVGEIFAGDGKVAQGGHTEALKYPG